MLRCRPTCTCDALCSVDTDPCLIDNGGCDHDCEHIDGQAVCTCPDTMTLADDLQSCEREYSRHVNIQKLLSH